MRDSSASAACARYATTLSVAIDSSPLLSSDTNESSCDTCYSAWVGVFLPTNPVQVQGQGTARQSNTKAKNKCVCYVRFDPVVSEEGGSQQLQSSSLAVHVLAS